MKRIKGFSFDTIENKELIEHIESQGNQSDYIKKLVKRDMEDNNLEELVKIQVDKYLESTAKNIIKSPNGKGHK